MEIESIKTYKKDLLDEIQKLKMEIDNVMAEVLSFEFAEEKGFPVRGSMQSPTVCRKPRGNPVPGGKQAAGWKCSVHRRVPLQGGGAIKNKTAIGEFLGEREELHLQTLKAFVELHEFSDLNLVQALSLHNPNVKDRTTLDRFNSMNRGINNGEDLPDDLLSKLYESIRSEPFKIPEDDGNNLTHTFFNPDREGWLLKLGGRVKTWKRRWFILTSVGNVT
uniref:cytohesin-4-like n=1 Tax=Solea senegalensis TaxID=28829 RepID=UPI001CD85CC2|nr:cytohesin-4-like [Solea senegalensis]